MIQALNEAVTKLVEYRGDDGETGCHAVLIVGTQSIDDEHDLVSRLLSFTLGGNQPLYITNGLVSAEASRIEKVMNE